MPDDYIRAIERLGPRLGHVHFSDGEKRTSEVHFAPGTGCLDLEGIVSALKKIGFQESVMLDLWLYPFPLEELRLGAPYVQEVVAKLGISTT